MSEEKKAEPEPHLKLLSKIFEPKPKEKEKE